MNKSLAVQVSEAAQLLGKWRKLYAGWWFGTRPDRDPGSKAARDNFDRTILTRCEVNALVKILLDKKLITEEEWLTQLLDEYQWMNQQMQDSWPGIRAEPDGLVFFDLPKAVETMKAKGIPE